MTTPPADANHPRHAGRLLITAGPTHEPIDSVRYIGNRSSGRLGVDLADTAAERGWEVVLLLGPTHLAPEVPGVRVVRYQTTSDLAALLLEHQSWCDVLVMAAAVADFRPRVTPEQLEGKIRRRDAELVIELEPTEDLLAGCSSRRSPGQTLVGFALEPRERLRSSALDKLDRKGIDLIVANPLGTMEAGSIEAIVFGRDGTERATDGPMNKRAFGGWLMELIEEVIPCNAS